MEMKITKKGTKKFTKTEKLSILKEAKKAGVKKTLEKYDLYPGTYYYWKRKYIVYGEDGLDHKKLKNAEKVISELEKENERLKLLLADKELESALKDDLLKKSIQS